SDGRASVCCYSVAAQRNGLKGECAGHAEHSSSGPGAREGWRLAKAKSSKGRLGNVRAGSHRSKPSYPMKIEYAPPSSPSRVLEIGGSLELSRRGRKFVGRDRIDLLEAIGRLGSISRAAKEVNLSYKTAWEAVDLMNNLAQKPLLIRAIGGQHGG